jgi:hypothetical protein
MHEAVDKLIKNLRGGKLTNLDPKDPWPREFAKNNLIIGVTGAKSRKAGLPCYTFVDNGEGQHPENFANTFLSLSSGNKKGIPFVQGSTTWVRPACSATVGRESLSSLCPAATTAAGHGASR